MRHPESHLQQVCLRWARLQHPVCRKLLISVPNGAHISLMQAKILKGEGMLAGASDLLLLVPKDNVPYLAIEMKTEKGRLSEYQKEFRDAVQEQGGRYEVVRSFEEFRKLIDEYLL